MKPLMILFSITVMGSACWKIPGSHTNSIWTDDITTIEVLLTDEVELCHDKRMFTYKMSDHRLTPRRVSLFKSISEFREHDVSLCKQDFVKFERASFVVNPGTEQAITYATTRDACLYHKDFQGKLRILSEEDFDRILQEIKPKRYGMWSYTRNETDVFYSREYDLENGPFGIILEGADPLSFRAMRDSYGADERAVWFESRKILESDPSTFIPREGAWSQDGYRVYYLGVALPDADVKTFQYSTGAYGRDKNSVYYTNLKIDGVDPNTFQPGSFVYYSRDQKSVIYGGSIVEGADPTTFTVVADAYALDVNAVYSQGKRLDMNRAAFVYLGQNYAGDDSKVYYFDQRVEGADVATFQPGQCIGLTGPRLMCVKAQTDCYAQDKNAKYKNGIRVP